MAQANPFQPNYSNVERSTNLAIFVQQIDGTPIEIGAISDFTVSESRQVTEHFAFGSGQTDEPRVLIPGVRTNASIRCSRLSLWKSNIIKAFANVNADNYIASILDQKAPFDILTTQTKSDDPTQMITVIYKGCFIVDCTRTQQIQSSVAIVENVTIKWTNLEVA